MYAIQNEHVRVVKELLLAGADATAGDRVRVGLVWHKECEKGLVSCLTCASVFECTLDWEIFPLKHYELHMNSQPKNLSIFTTDCFCLSMKASRVGNVEVTRLLVTGRATLDLKSKVHVNLPYCDVAIFALK